EEQQRQRRNRPLGLARQQSEQQEAGHQSAGEPRLARKPAGGPETDADRGHGEGRPAQDREDQTNREHGKSIPDLKPKDTENMGLRLAGEGRWLCYPTTESSSRGAARSHPPSGWRR